MKEKITSIRCNEQTIKKLKENKIHHRETHEETILRLLKEVKQK